MYLQLQTCIPPPKEGLESLHRNCYPAELHKRRINASGGAVFEPCIAFVWKVSYLYLHLISCYVCMYVCMFVYMYTLYECMTIL